MIDMMVSPWHWPWSLRPKSKCWALALIPQVLGLVLKSLAFALMPLTACISLLTVTDAHDSNSYVHNVNKIPHVDDFTYLQYFCCCNDDLKPFRC